MQLTVKETFLSFLYIGKYIFMPIALDAFSYGMVSVY